MHDLLHKQRKIFADEERRIMKEETLPQKRYTPPSDAQLEVNYHEGKLLGLRREIGDYEATLASLRARPVSAENQATIKSVEDKKKVLQQVVDISVRKAEEARKRMAT